MVFVKFAELFESVYNNCSVRYDTQNLNTWFCELMTREEEPDCCVHLLSFSNNFTTHGSDAGFGYSCLVR